MIFDVKSITIDSMIAFRGDAVSPPKHTAVH